LISDAAALLVADAFGEQNRTFFRAFGRDQNPSFCFTLRRVFEKPEI
jgi:hypothetical protein